MFEISMIVLTRVLLVVAGFCVYRWISPWRGFDQAVIGRSRSETRMRTSTQKGFVSLNEFARQTNRNTRSFGGNFRTPWGW